MEFVLLKLVILIVTALLGAAGFRSRWGRHALQHHLGGGWCCLHPNLVGVSGAFASSVARWAQVALGIVPRSVLCAAGGGAAVYGRLARGETRQRANSMVTW